MDFSTVVGVATHDMKNSVGVITAYLEDLLAQQSTAASPEAGQLLQQTLYEAQRVNGHLVQLMAMYKLERGLYPFDPEEVDLDEFAQEAASRVAPLARIKGLALEVEVDENLLGGYFDRELLLSVVTQAMFNAVRYTHSRIVLRVQGGAGALSFAIDDDGLGFPSFMLEQAFATKGINSQTGSTGLGLYFARQVALLHRREGSVGTTRLENLPSGGGRFTILLP
ncbi:MAG: HAMP domain-containing histidine kinase [Paucibacter sp.]|nr:HAMP domain-containing histidine kinase [Roseateles sp.]